MGRRYELVERLVEGGMGAVWAASDRKTGGEVVVKLMHASLVADEEAVKRFEQEATVMRSLQSPHIVSFISHGMLGRTPYLVLERLHGEDLADRLTDGPMPLEETAQVIDEMAKALLAASARGVVHRDIKPANIFMARVTEDGEERTVTKLLDFGIVKLTEGRRIKTAYGVTVGSPAFMSPEQVRGDALDARSDLFALGAVAYACITGQSAFEGGDVGVTFQNILHARYTPPSQLRPGLPEGLDGFFAIALAASVEDRFQHASAMARAFREAIATATARATAPADAPATPTHSPYASTVPPPRSTFTSTAPPSDPPALHAFGDRTRLALRAHIVTPLARAEKLASEPRARATTWAMLAAAVLAVAGATAALWPSAHAVTSTEVAAD